MEKLDIIIITAQHMGFNCHLMATEESAKRSALGLY